MQYNVLVGALFEVNTTEGNKEIPFSYMTNLVDYGETPVFGLTEEDIFVMDFDLGHRIHLDKFEYKFGTSYADSNAVASGISFYAKEEIFDTYSLLNTFVLSSGIFYTNDLDEAFTPRYLRLKHNLADTYGVTVISGSVYGFKAYNNDTIVNFGADGTKTTETIETARGSEADIRAIAIYNSGIKKSDAFVNLEPDFSPIDEVIYISSSSSGPWIKALDSGDLIADQTNFNYGYKDNVETATGPLSLVGVEDQENYFFSKEESGSYTTKIFKKNNTYCRLVVVNEGLDDHVITDSSDATETIEVRSSNAPPKPYAIIRELVNFSYVSGSITYKGLTYRDRWLETQEIKNTSSNYFLYTDNDNIWRDYGVFYDQSTERWAGYASHYSKQTSYVSLGELWLFNNVDETYKTYRLSYQSSTGSPVTFSWYDMRLDITGGMWIYLYCQGYHSGDFINSTGYYLAYFDSELTNMFKWFTLNKEIGSLDVNYESRHVWYTRPESNAIYKVSNTGTIDVNYSDEDTTSDLGGIVVLSDGNVIFANDKDLHGLKYNGIYLSEYFIEDVAEDKISYIVLDGDGSEAVWVIDGSVVGRLFIAGENKGVYDFRVILDTPVRMTSVSDGVWVYCAGTGDDSEGAVKMCFISKENHRVDVTYVPEANSSPGLLYQSYTHANYTSKMPVSSDTNWSSLEWKKVAIQNYLSPEDQYYQLRITLRRQEPIERYSEFITDPEQEFFSNDDFTQESSTPKKLLWGEWRNYPLLDRIYVDTIEDQLVMVPNGVTDAYINTKQRLAVGLNENNELDIRVKFTFGEGDGIVSGNAEYIYLNAYSVEQGYTDKYLSAYMFISTTPETSYNYVYGGANGNYGSWSNRWQSLNMYDAELRLYWNGSSVTGSWRNPGGDFSTGSSLNITSNSVGNYFYIEILGDKDSSQLKIDYMEVYKGEVYYYTETPLITSIYKQELVEIKDIYPNNYKNIYVKTLVPKDLDIASGYDIDMKVRWRISTY